MGARRAVPGVCGPRHFLLLAAIHDCLPPPALNGDCVGFAIFPLRSPIVQEGQTCRVQASREHTSVFVFLINICLLFCASSVAFTLRRWLGCRGRPRCRRCAGGGRREPWCSLIDMYVYMRIYINICICVCVL